jgi:Leucine-rich repeat (LRR) protein
MEMNNNVDILIMSTNTDEYDVQFLHGLPVSNVISPKRQGNRQKYEEDMVQFQMEYLVSQIPNAHNRLYLDNNQINGSVFKYLMESLDQNNDVWDLTLSNNNINNLHTPIKVNNNTLSFLTLNENDLTDNDMEVISNMVRGMHRLLGLYLCHNNISTQGFELFLNTVQNPSIESIHLTHNDIQNIDPNLKIPTSTRYLYLNNNKLNDEDAKVISKSDTKLFHLDLSDNQITFAGFVDIINNQDNLSILTFKNNEFNTNIEYSLNHIDTVHSNMKLNTLYLNDNQFGSNAAKVVGKLHEKYTHLKYIWLPRNLIDDETALTIVTSMLQLPIDGKNQININLAYNLITTKGFKDILTLYSIYKDYNVKLDLLGNAGIKLTQEDINGMKSMLTEAYSTWEITLSEEAINFWTNRRISLNDKITLKC